nr:hypothetical protein BaRGS_023577 [Batillaria attramentaria]
MPEDTPNQPKQSRRSVSGTEVLVSDTQADTVFRVDLDTGRVVGKLTHPDLKRPHQVPADGTGNCYIASSSGTFSFDPMTSSPSRVLVIKPDVESTDAHKNGPWLRSVVTTSDGRLVTIDIRNKAIKVVDPSSLTTTVHGLKLDKEPCGLALLRDDVVAVTAHGRNIYFVDVTNVPEFAAKTQTSMQYIGVSAAMRDDTLVVSSQSPPSVDVITRAGVMLRTVIDCHTFRELTLPENLHVLLGDEVLVSDTMANTVFRVRLDTGSVVGALTHPELKHPSQVTADRAGNCYIASSSAQCVLVVTPDGQWLRLLYGPEHGDATRVSPEGVCVTDWGVVVTWHPKSLQGHSVVAGYKLK